MNDFYLIKTDKNQEIHVRGHQFYLNSFFSKHKS